MRDLFDIGFDDGLSGTSPVTNSLDEWELARYMRGWNEGHEARNVLEAQ